MDPVMEKLAADRALLHARLILTRRPDVMVQPFPDFADNPLDLLVQLAPKRPSFRRDASPCFGVEIMHTLAPLATVQAATRHVNQHRNWQSSPVVMQVPIILFLFSISKDRGYYSWVLRPHTPHTPEDAHILEQIVKPRMQPITKATLDEIVEEVADWFDTILEQTVLVPQAK